MIEPTAHQKEKTQKGKKGHRRKRLSFSIAPFIHPLTRRNRGKWMSPELYIRMIFSFRVGGATRNQLYQTKIKRKIEVYNSNNVD